MQRYATLIAILFIFSVCRANQGMIDYFTFSGAGYGQHPDVVQISLTNQYGYSGCSPDYAGIRKQDTHLISAALTAYSLGKEIYVGVNPNDKYIYDRCVINHIELR